MEQLSEQKTATKRGRGRPRKHDVDADVVVTPEQYAARMAQHDAAEFAAKAANANANFFMIFKREGSPALRGLIAKSGVAAQIFIFLAEQMDRTNAVVASGTALSECLGISKGAVSKAVKLLVEENYVIRLNSGGTSVFALNDEYVWTAWASGKKTSMFRNASVLIAKSEQDTHAKRHINAILTKHQPDQAARDALESRGQQRLDIDPETGEILQ